MIDKKLHYPILSLNFKDSFEQLTDEEKEYTYYLSRACWDGAPITLFQVSYESAPLFIIFQNFFSSFQPFDEFKKIIFLKSKGRITDVDYKQFIRYAAKFYSNMGNYSAFGEIKFIPGLDSEKFEEILKCSTTYNEINYIWDCIKDIVYDNSTPFKTINLNEKEGKNSYYLGDIKEEHIKFIDGFLQEKGISPLNTRLMKINHNKFACLIPSVEEKIEEWDTMIIAYFGEFAPFLKRVVNNLEEASKVCSNESHKKMLQSYIDSFLTGSIEKHKDAQRMWVVEHTSHVEMNCGWIETSIDPLCVRAAFQGWVGLIDREKTKKFKAFAENAQKLLGELFSWPLIEKCQDNLHDFIAVDLVCYASTWCPLGINIPHYADIIESHGCKSISFSNAYPSFKPEYLNFCSEKDEEILKQIGAQAMLLAVACHQFLGHGSGKLLRVSETGEYNVNFDISNLKNPLTNAAIEKYYGNNETYESKFGDIARPFEELRAGLASLFFCFYKEFHLIFEYEESLYKDIIYSIWLIYIRSGIIGLTVFNEDHQKWGHAHTHGAWVFIQYLMENQLQGQEILSIVFEEGKRELNINLNKEMVMCYGPGLVEKLFTCCQVWKITGDYAEAKAFFDKYSTVDDYFMKIKNFISEHEIPYRLELNHNLTYSTSTSILVKEYPESLEGIIESFVDRYPTELSKDIYAQWTKYDTNFFK